MSSVQKSVLVPFSAPTMFDLVDRVEEYPQFLPWCGGAEALARSSDMTKARIHIDYHGVRQSFTTMNRKQDGEWMHIELIDGPFQMLIGHWHFRALAEQACKVELRLDYAFSNKVLERLVGPVFDHIANTFIERFVQRAEALYVPPQ